MKKGLLVLMLVLIATAALAEDEATQAIFGSSVGQDQQQVLAPNPDAFSISQKNLYRNPLYYGVLAIALIILMYSLIKHRRDRLSLEQEKNGLDIKRSVKCEGCNQEYGLLEKNCPYCNKTNRILHDEERVEEKTHTLPQEVTMGNIEKIEAELPPSPNYANEPKQTNEPRIEEKVPSKVIEENKTESVTGAVVEKLSLKSEKNQESKEDNIPQIQYKMKKCKGCGFGLFIDDKVCPVCETRQ